jgi:hypothetical protein
MTWKQQRMELSQQEYDWEASRGVDKLWERPPHLSA